MTAGRGTPVGRPFLLWLERLLVLAGAIALAWAAFFVADGAVAQWRAQAILADAPRESALAAADIPEPALIVPPAAAPADTPIAALVIPRLDLSLAVFEGADARTLRRGPGLVEHTARPGYTGNVVIAGHRDTFFAPLRHIRLGDEVFLGTARGRIRYEVTSVRVTTPADLTALAPTDGATLTLVTCYPFGAFAAAPERVVVRATTVPQQPAVEDVVTAYLVALDEPVGSCAVTVEGEAATVDCARRTFTLERTRASWAIRTITVR